MNVPSEELYELYERSEERLRRSQDRFKRRQVELECARKQGTAYQVDTALENLRSASFIAVSMLTEHLEHFAAYVASELRDR